VSYIVAVSVDLDWEFSEEAAQTIRRTCWT